VTALWRALMLAGTIAIASCVFPVDKTRPIEFSNQTSQNLVLYNGTGEHPHRQGQRKPGHITRRGADKGEYPDHRERDQPNRDDKPADVRDKLATTRSRFGRRPRR
jgi:hypothetical protein